MKYLKIKNWETFQQYKDREPKWIKLHRGLLRDYEFGKLSDIQKAHLLSLWLLAAETDNKIPYDEIWIKSQAQLKQKPEIEQLLASGFIALYETVQSCTEVYETVPREEKRREEKSGEKPEDNFTAFYDAYPRSEGKAKAIIAYKKALSKVSHIKLMAALDLYKKQIQVNKTETKFIKLPATWLNGEHWQDNYQQQTQKVLAWN